MAYVLQNQTQSPLIGIIVQEQGKEAADAAVSQRTTQDALAVIGAWDDLDWDETVQALDRIRYESKPTPPIMR